jgi:hypothetical protein
MHLAALAANATPLDLYGASTWDVSMGCLCLGPSRKWELRPGGADGDTRVGSDRSAVKLTVVTGLHVKQGRGHV